MSGCTTDKRSFEQQIQAPVEQAFEQWEQACEDVRQAFEEQAEQWIEGFEEQSQRVCSSWPWPLNWLCQMVTVLVKVVMKIVVVVIKWVVYTVCRTICTVVRVLVTLTLRLAKLTWVFVCALGQQEWVEALETIPEVLSTSVQVAEDAAHDVVDTALDAAKGIAGLVLGVVADVIAVTLSSIVCSFEPAETQAACRQNVKNAFLGVAKTLDAAFEFARALSDGAVLVVAGLLRGDVRKMLEGVASITIGGLLGIVHVMRTVLLAPLADAFRETGQGSSLRDCVEKLIKELVPSESREQMRMAVGLDVGKVRMTWPFTVTRFYLDSEAADPTVNPRNLHPDFLNLYSLVSSGVGPSFANPRSEMLIAGTQQNVTSADIDRYLAGDPNRPRFRIYPMPRAVLDRHIDTAVTKAREIGLHLVFTVREQAAAQWFDARVSRNADPVKGWGLAQLLTTSLGRGVAAGEQCVGAAAALLRDDPVLDLGIFGVTALFPANGLVSGLEYRDAWPDQIYRYVLIHEMGHYFGLDHPGHTGPNHIMWSVGAAKLGETPYVSAETFGELYLSAEPRFTAEDACNVWRWILTNSRGCISLPNRRPRPLPE